MNLLNSRQGAHQTYRYLFSTFFKGKLDAELDNIKIINFNYDRSFDYTLEYFLRCESARSYEFKEIETEFKSRALVKSKIERPEVVHPYGSLGTLETFPYAESSKILHDKFDQIRVISSERVGFQHPRNLLEKSKSIIFLGFGFDSTNIENLGLLDLKTQKDISQTTYWFTNYKMDNFTLTRVMRSIFGVYQDKNKNDILREAPLNQGQLIVESVSSSQMLASI